MIAKPQYGIDLPRADAYEKLTGGVIYTSDIILPGMLQAKVLRSPHAHARILRIDASQAAALPGVVTVVTGQDLVDMERTTGMRLWDWPIIAFDKVRYVGDIVAAVAAVDEKTAFTALGLINVEYEVLPAAMTVEAALAPDAPEIFDPVYAAPPPRFGPGASAIMAPARNVCYRFEYEKGDIEGAFARCDHVFEDTFRHSRVQHFHFEPFVTIAQWTGGRLELWTGQQSPFPLRQEMARIFRLPQSEVRIHVTYVGGGFGAKNACRTDGIAGLLARKTKRPVRLCYAFDENFLTASQNAAILKVRTGVLNDGTLVARESTIYLESGAYSDHSPLVSEKCGYRIPGVYRWDALRTRCDVVMTNTVPAGAHRGFGGPQAAWAAESQIDMIARRLGLDPYVIRVKNMLGLGEAYSATGESAMDSDLKLGLDLICERLGYHERCRVPGRGMGFSVAMKDGGGQKKGASVSLKLTTEGRAIVRCGAVELGQGILTGLGAIVADILKIPRSWVGFTEIDTDVTPYYHGTTSAAGGTVMGKAIEQAAHDVRTRVLTFAAGELGCDPAELDLAEWQIWRGDERIPMTSMIARVFGTWGGGYDFEGTGFYKMPSDTNAPLGTRTMFWETGWAGAEVEVDEQTGEVRLLKLIVSGDCGKALNHAGVEGQEESCALIAYGQTMFERLVYRDGQLVNGSPLNYRIMTAADIPAGFEMIFQEQGHGPGPFGSKGAGEGSLLSVSAAIANAVDDAVGARVTDLPLSPDHVFAALQQRDATTVPTPPQRNEAAAPTAGPEPVTQSSSGGKFVLKNPLDTLAGTLIMGIIITVVLYGIVKLIAVGA